LKKKGLKLRIAFKIALTGYKTVPATYRKNIVALLKEALKNSADIDLMGMNSETKQKPFTFSLRFDVLESKDGNLKLASDEFDLYFSTNNYAVFTAVYNYILGSLDRYSIFGGGLTNILLNTSLLPPKELRDDSVVFETLSPILVRDMRNKNGDKTLRWDEDGFVENLALSIKSTIKAFIGDEISPPDLDIKIIQMKSDNIMSYGDNKKSYGVYGNSGLLEISTKKEYLQLLYDVGVGGKRSQGFGMVEVMGG